MKTFSICERKEIIDSVVFNIDHIEDLWGKDCINNITNTVSNDIVQNLIYFKNSDSSSAESVIRDIITRELILCEKRSSGSSEIMIIILSYFLSRIKTLNTNKEKLESLKKVKDEIEDLCLTVSPHVTRASRDDIVKLVKFQKFPKNIQSIILDMIGKIDPRNGCDVEKTNKFISFSAIKRGHIIGFDKLDLYAYNIKKWKRENSQCIMVDGIIERVSQINHILEIFSKEKNPVVIFCRSASEEVKETLRINFIRGTLDIVLIEAGFDIEYLHFFKDMSAIFDCDYANIKKGDVISTMLKDIIFTIGSVEIENRKITLINKNNNANYLKDYSEDVSMLRYKIDENSMDIEDVASIKKMIDKRVSFLSSSKFEIKIGTKDLDSDKFIISKIDKLFRSFPDISHLGIVNLRNVNGKNPILKMINSKISKKIFSQREIFEGIVSAYRVYESILKAEKLFTIDK